MPRRRRRTRSGAPLLPLLIAAFLAAIVVWAIYPRSHRPRIHKDVAYSSATPLAVPSSTPTAATLFTALPTATPTASTASSAPPTPASTSAHIRIAIIIDDCGQWLQTERGFLALPIPLTLAVLPHVRYTAEIAGEANTAGKGVMLHLPMEPFSHIYPGPGEIKTSMSDAQVVAQLQDDLAQVPLAVGVNNHEGSEASADPRVMNDVLQVLKSRGLFFIDSRTTTKSVGAAIAQQLGVPNASRNVFLDDRASVAYTESMLDRTLAIAQRDGSAIAIGHPKPTTLAALRAEYPKMRAAGVQFVFVQQLVR